MLKPYNPNDAFNETAEVSYFLDHNYRRKGIGTLAFAKLLDDAKRLGKMELIATISGDNETSIAFHRKLGFIECGRFHDIGFKFNKRFDLVFIQFSIA